MYLWIFDDGKRTTEAKIADACEVFRVRYGTPPTVILISTDEPPPSVAPCEVRAVAHVRKSNFQIGMIEA